MNTPAQAGRFRVKTEDGRFIRPASTFRHWVSADGAAGPTGEGGFPAQPGRYHLYVSPACPWAHRTLILRKLKGLEEMISLSAVGTFDVSRGWSFAPEPGVIPDTINGAAYLSEVYLRADPGYSGRCTVPALWDRQRRTIVNNESSEIIRMFNSAFDGVGANDRDFYPLQLRELIDEFNDFIYPNINNGVYRAGFATSQDAYEEAAGDLFAALDRLEVHLATHRYLAGDTLTEADWRLFPTLVRFDSVYYGHFKCNRKRLVDYPNLWGYTRDLYQVPGVADTVNIPFIKKHYYTDQRMVNPTGIVPIGPVLDFTTPHEREGVGPR